MSDPIRVTVWNEFIHEVESEIVEMGRVRSTWRQRLVDGDTELFNVDVHVAFTDLAGRPRRAPEGFVEAAAEAL